MIEQPRITGRTKLYGLIGNPIKGSLSPAIHNYSAVSLQLDCCYVPLPIQGSDLTLAHLDALRDFGFAGLNVTVPYKEQVSQYLPNAQLNSVNTLASNGGEWQAHSTDGAGFLAGLAKIMDLDELQTVLLLGSGGAALAIAEALAALPQVAALTVLRRSTGNDQMLQDLAGAKLRLGDFRADGFATELRRESRPVVVIQASSAPLHGEPLQDFAAELTARVQAVVDITYGCQSALLTRAKALQIAHQDGLAMLVGQALLAQKIWWGRAASFTRVLDYLHRSLLS